MENETEHEIQEEPVQEEPKKFGDKYMLPIAIVVAGVMVAGAMVYNNGNQSQTQTAKNTTLQNGQATLIDGGNILPLEAEEKMLATLVANGSIDPSKLSQVTELNLFFDYIF